MRTGLFTLGMCLIAITGQAAAEDVLAVETPSAVEPNKLPSPVQTPVPTQNPTLDKKPVPAGGIRVTTRAPDLGKWDVVVGANRAIRTFNCKPLACADVERVTIVTSRSPTRNPDPQALEKYATIDFPKTLKAGVAAQEILTGTPNQIQNLQAKTSHLKGYPSILNETKFTINKKPVFLNTAIIFAGPLMLKLTSISPNRELAQRSLNEFVNAAAIEEGPAPTAQSSAPQQTGSKPVGESL